MGAVHYGACLLTLLVVLSAMEVDGAGIVNCNIVWASENCPVWYRYKKLFIESAEGGTALLRCLNDQNDTNCSEQELAVKEVFRQYYLDGCTACCRLRLTMVRDLLKHWERSGLVMSMSQN